MKFKKYLKNGNLEKIQNEPDIELLGDEESSEGQNDGETELTEKTGFYDNNDNNINNVKVNKGKKINLEKGDEINNNIGSDHEENNVEGDNNEQENKTQNEENDGDNIVSGENNEGSNSGGNRSSISREVDE